MSEGWILNLTWPRWPISHECVRGLLKQDNLWVYQAWRTSSLTVQTPTPASSTVPISCRRKLIPDQLKSCDRSLWRTAMVGHRSRKNKNNTRCSDVLVRRRQLTACWFGNMQELNFFRTTLCVFHNSCWHCYGPTSFCLLNAVTFIMFTAWDFMLMWT